ncbi:MAG: hypothetical protein ACOZBZ_00315 [Patescibacteria group bacterium]
MDTTQILLIITVLVLTTILSIVGVEVFLILKEFRQSVRKMNKILDDTGIISESIAKPISGISDLATGLRSLAEFIKTFLKEGGGEEKKIEKKSSFAEASEDKEKQEELPSESPARRFFLRAGKRLS